MRASQCVKVWIDNAIINRLVVARRSFWIGPNQLDQARDPGRPAGELDRRSCLSKLSVALHCKFHCSNSFGGACLIEIRPLDIIFPSPSSERILIV